MSEPRTRTGVKVVAIYGSRLIDDVPGIEAEAVAGFIDLIETAAEDNGQNAVLVEDLPALAHDFLHGNDKPSAGDKAEAPPKPDDSKFGAFMFEPWDEK